MKSSQDRPQKKGSTKTPSPKLKQMLRENFLMKETLSKAREVQGKPQTSNGLEQAQKERAGLTDKDLH